MALLHIIAHRIQRSDPTQQTTLNLREKAWEKDGKIEECFHELKHTFIKRFSKEYGRFSDDYAKHPMSSWLNEYTEGKINFESYTQKSMQHFKSAIDNIEDTIEGILFFAHEKLENDELIHVFFVEHNTGQFIDNDLSINESLYLDTNNIELAAKINIYDWKSNDKHRTSNAITLLKWRGAKEISDAFIEFVGFAEKIDLSADTEEFLNTVSEYTKELPDIAAHYTKKKIVDYCLEQDKTGQAVSMEDLAINLRENPLPQLSDDPETPLTKLADFAEFTKKRTPEAKKELIPDKTQLRQYVRISGRDNSLSMSFLSSCLGDTIVYDPSSDSLTIKNLPPALKQRLVKHFKDDIKKDN